MEVLALAYAICILKYIFPQKKTQNWAPNAGKCTKSLVKDTKPKEVYALYFLFYCYKRCKTCE